MYKALFISPMIPSFNIKKTIDFFKDILEFSAVMDTAQYAICEKDNLTIHIMPAGKEIGEMSFYLEVDDVDTLWASINDKVKGLKVKEPFNREYGMREIHVEVPETNTLLFIGQTISI